MSATSSRGVVVSPHYLATKAGHVVLAHGGNAVDAVIATALSLAVVTPYYCGFGGDCFAIVHDGAAHGYLGAGRAPAAANLSSVSNATHGLRPVTGALSVTVPGGVQGWFDLLERFGTRSFGDLARGALDQARSGFMLSGSGAERLRATLDLYPGNAELQASFGRRRQGDWLAQPRSAALIELLIEGGPAAFYRDEVAAAIEARVAAEGGLLTTADLAAHTGEWVHPVSVPYADVDVVELPPPSQGIAALEALRIIGDVPAPGVERVHRQIEATKLALADRDAFVGDPAAAAPGGLELLTDAWVEQRRAEIDPDRARRAPPRAADVGDTAYLAAVDDDGCWVSFIQSNYRPFGSGLRVQEWGITLHNRGASFQLEAEHPNAWGPRARPLHTLAPALLQRDGLVVAALGTMGGDTQTQVHTQLITALVADRAIPAAALGAPRWRVEPSTTTVHVEPAFDAHVVEGLRARGHSVVVDPPEAGDDMGHAAIIQADGDGYVGASDPRCEGRALGL